MYHYLGLTATFLPEAVMHTTAIRSAHSLGIFDDSTPSRWSARLRSILDRSWFRKNEEAAPGSLHRLDDRPLADVGLYREHGIHNPENRTDRQQGAPVPAAVLAMWMSPV
jgi:uncharacterized protein YjiS (DUF1127 family)